MFKKILIAHDLSTLADSATKLGVWLAKKSQASIKLTHIIADFKKAFLNLSAEARNELAYGDIEKFEVSLRKDANEKLENFIKTIDNEGLCIEHSVDLGTPHVAISHIVDREKFDLVISGTREMGAIKRALIGSTAKNLVRHCPSAVWIIKDHDVMTISSIVVPVDFSEISEKALQAALWVASQSGAKLKILHVIDNKDYPTSIFSQIFSSSSSSKEWSKEVENSAEKSLNQLAIKYAIKDCELKVLWGDPSTEIIEFIENSKADLVVMGTVGRSGLAGILLGNTAEKVLENCKVDLLSIKPESFKTVI